VVSARRLRFTVCATQRKTSRKRESDFVTHASLRRNFPMHFNEKFSFPVANQFRQFAAESQQNPLRSKFAISTFTSLYRRKSSHLCHLGP
jgi:hypothetical protein